MGTELAPGICRGRGPGAARAGGERGRGRGLGSEAGGGAHPQGGQVDVVQAAGGGRVAHGRRRAAHAPARSLRCCCCRRRRFSPIGGPGEGGGGLHRACPKGRGRGGGRASGRTDPAAADGRSLSPARLQPEPPAAPAHARSGAVTRARRAPPPAGRRHLRAGAGERAAGARRPRSLAGSPAWKERAHLLGARAHTPSLPFPFLLLLFFWPRLP